MTTDADLRLVAQAIGFRVVPFQESQTARDEYSEGDWPNIISEMVVYALVKPDGDDMYDNSPFIDAPVTVEDAWKDVPKFHQDDGLAAKWLLPWLEKMSMRGGNFRLNYVGPGLYFAELDYRRDPRGKVVFYHVPPRSSFAAALFDLCLHIIKEECHA